MGVRLVVAVVVRVHFSKLLPFGRHSRGAVAMFLVLAPFRCARHIRIIGRRFFFAKSASAALSTRAGVSRSLWSWS